MEKIIFKESESNPEIPGNFYVSVINGERWTPVYGPFKTHSEALENVNKAKTKGNEVDPKSVFYAWGTIKMTESYSKPGILNQYFV
jgi:hypothetical protein